ncbi:MAG: sensor histidine kinase [Pseudomonadota bacterium]|nr:sensor histidine kinase [Pseudomonadota bacterium]
MAATWIVGCLFFVFLGTAVFAAEKVDEQVRIGVLAKRGSAHCFEKWGPTAEYLTRQIPGRSFSIIPLGFDEINQAVEGSEVEFILANSSFYVGMEIRFGARRIATLKNLHTDGTAHKVFAGVIFCKADREEIRNLQDLKKKSFMAVDELSLGGWHMAWYELKKHGVDPRRDFADLRFGGSHDAVVYAVRDGYVDAGSVRSDTLERMVLEGNIRLADFKVLNPHENCTGEVRFLHSTSHYPEWPFAKAFHTSDVLAEEVAVALVQMPANSLAAQTARCAGWTIPQNYRPVHECLMELRLSPYEDYGKVTFADVLSQYWSWMLSIVVLATLIFLFVIRASRLEERLQQSARDEAKLQQAHDELEEKVAERTFDLEEANKSLQDMDKLKSMFIASMSHELRTPLNSIIGFSGLLLQGVAGELNDKQRDSMERIYRSGNHLLGLISDVIDISKIEAGRVDVFYEPFSLKEVVEEAIETIRPQADAKGLELEFNEDTWPRMNSDRKRLLQCLLNYLSNAVKFSETGKVSLTVSVIEDMVELRVSDTGIGIADEDMPKLFEAFERLDTHLRVKAGGTGLGLYLTKKITEELLQGRVSVESCLNEGSTFALRIPLDVATVMQEDGHVS